MHFFHDFIFLPKPQLMFFLKKDDYFFHNPAFCRLAPETMRQFIYTQMTDVWAYGIMCWEIYSNGIEPYPGMSPAETFVKVKTEMFRMPLPACVPAEIGEIITKRCWAENPNDRWSMQQLAHRLELITRLPRPKAGGVSRGGELASNNNNGGGGGGGAAGAKRSQLRKGHHGSRKESRR